MAKKVIVIDDSQYARKLVSRALSGVGVEVVEAVDGLDGITKLAEHPDAGVVICDENMPKMGGLEMLAAIRQTSLLLGRSVLMLSTAHDERGERQAVLLGAVGWIVKPFEVDSFVATVEELLARGPTGRLLSADRKTLN